LNFACPVAYAGLALFVGAADPTAAGQLWLLPYVFAAISAIVAIGGQVLWRRWSPADLPVHRARARASDLPILRVRLIQVWALDSLVGVFGFVLAFLGFPRDVWIWFVMAPAVLLFLHHPSQLRLVESAG
jgi:hypothetical protein